MFRFTIRDLLWLMMVAALALGWYAEHRRRSITRAYAHELRANLRRAHFRYDPQLADKPEERLLQVDWQLIDAPIP
jgi:hypothetical protein